jgi:hypothetical protein
VIKQIEETTIYFLPEHTIMTHAHTESQVGTNAGLDKVSKTTRRKMERDG